MNNNRLIVIRKVKEFCLDIDNLIINFPKKEYVIKEKILVDSLSILEDVIYINYVKVRSNVVEYKFKLLTKISMLDFYFEYLFKKNIINQKVFNKLGKKLNEISRLIYGWLKDGC